MADEEKIEEVKADISSDSIQKSEDLAKSLQNITNFRHEAQFYELSESLLNSFRGSLNNREGYYRNLDRLRDNYITNGIYDVIVNDLFMDTGSIDFISVEVEDNADIESELQDLFNKLNISNTLVTIVEDLLHDGSYPLRVESDEENGITKLVDDLEARSVVSVYGSDNIPLFHFTSHGSNAGYSKRVTYNYHSIKDIVCFSLDYKFTKLQLQEKAVAQIKGKVRSDLEKASIPQSMKIRTPKSFISGVLDKLNDTLLLDKIYSYKNIASLISPTVIGVPVPDVYDPKSLSAIVDKYDTLLNSDLSRLSTPEELDLTMRDISRVKVVPVAGDRSNVSPIDTGVRDSKLDVEVVKESLLRVLNALGIPEDLFFGVVDGKSNLKSNVRYAKKIKRIQKSIIRALKQICLIHLSIKYPDEEIFEDQIKIQIKNNVNIDALENLETQDLVIASIKSMMELVSDIEQNVTDTNYTVDKTEFMRVVKDTFSSIGSPYQSIFKEKNIEGSENESPRPEPESREYSI